MAYKFDCLMVEKIHGAAQHIATVANDSCTSTFTFSSEKLGASASLPLSKHNSGGWSIDRDHRGDHASERPRQIGFENLIFALAQCHPEGLVPCMFEDIEGTRWRFDKTAASWAVFRGRFTIVTDDDGIDSLRPRAW